MKKSELKKIINEVMLEEETGIGWELFAKSLVSNDKSIRPIDMLDIMKTVEELTGKMFWKTKIPASVAKKALLVVGYGELVKKIGIED